MKLKTSKLKSFLEKMRTESKIRADRFWNSEDGQIVKNRSKREQNRTGDGELGK